MNLDQPRRIAKACEACRVRRTRCSGVVPCDQCTVLGISPDCTIRAKARPRRNPVPAAPSLPQTQEPPNQHWQRKGTAQFIRNVEVTVDAWLAANGHTPRLTLPPIPLISTLPRTPLPTSPLELAALEDRLIFASRASEVQYMEFLTPSRINDLYARHRHHPDSLNADQKAVVAACLCLGRVTELAFDTDAQGGKRMRTIPPGSSREDVTYYHLALEYLEQWGSASCTALCALHCIVLFAMLVGGPEDSRELLGAMSWQARELGLHRRETAASYPAQDRVAPLFTSTLYKDTWYNTLCDTPPFSRWREYEVDPGAGPDVPSSQGILWRLAVLENELLGDVHSGRVDSTSPDFILDTEARWWPLMRECGDEHGDRPLAAVHPYADIRFNWIRLLLRAPCMNHPRLGPSSTPIVARSLSRILHTYGGITAKGGYFPCWAQLRRIVTCGQLLVLCYNARELGRGESEALFGVFLALLSEHVGSFAFVERLKSEFESVARILGLAIPDSQGFSEHFMAEELPFVFDYSVLSWFDPVDTLPNFQGPEDVAQLLGVGEAEGHLGTEMPTGY